MRLMVDLDGVLADFNQVYVPLLEKVSGKTLNLPEGWVPDHWYYEASLGFTPEEVSKAWDHIRESPTFLYNQPDFPWTLAALSRMELMAQRGWHVYFLTSRVGQTAKHWTEIWLAERGYDYPTVITCSASQKAQFCRLLDITHAVEDKPETLCQIQEACPDAKLALVPWAYNTEAQADIREGRWSGVEIVADLPAWLDTIAPHPAGVTPVHPRVA